MLAVDEDSLQGMKRAALEQSWSVTVRILLKPLEWGNLMMRSMAMVSKGRAVGVMVMGKWGIHGREVLTLEAWQVA
jgi:hypothetical protein